MSAQATDKSVNKCMKPLYEQDLTPDQVLKMEEAAAELFFSLVSFICSVFCGGLPEI